MKKKRLAQGMAEYLAAVAMVLLFMTTALVTIAPDVLENLFNNIFTGVHSDWGV